MDKYLTLKQVAEILGVSERTIKRRCSLGEFAKASRIGRLWRFSESALNEFLSK